MRQVRELANIQHKWLSLLISFLLWMTVWLIGGVVFWRSGSNAKWSYFEALYFAYTIWANPFSFFRSLLAVPTITILVSNLGDTAIRFIRDITLFIGELTILPGDQPFMDQLKALSRISWIGWWMEDTTGEKEEKPPGQRGDTAAENIHEYLYLLSQELRKMTEYACNTPSRNFDYLEWEYYISLIAGDNKPDILRAEAGDKQAQAVREWSWTDKKNPLLGEKSEVQWLLGELTEVLDRELSRASRGHKRKGEGDQMVAVRPDQHVGWCGRLADV
ncbi:unnamed protein product [Penicillium nalgiovense]|nr:unnamed protein product [Penicillium nalgiovense]